jgi:hypothetical protein
MAAPEKLYGTLKCSREICHLSTKFQIFKSKRFNLKLSTTWPSWNL